VSLSDWSQNGWLLPHRTSSQEIADLFAVVERDLADSAAESLSADWKLSIAYNAALQVAAAALAAEGYRAARDQHHYRVIQSLRFTIGAPPTLVGRFVGPFPSFDHRHGRDRKRHLGQDRQLNPDYQRTPGLPTGDFLGRQGRPTTEMSKRIAEEA
jgi:hypothetical protein